MRNLLFLFSVFCFQSSLFSLTKSQTPSFVPSGYFDKSYPLLEVKTGYFFFTSSAMRDVYSKGGFTLELSGSYPVYQCLQIYGNVGYQQAWGKSTGSHQNTTIFQIPVDLGLKPIFNIASFAQYYFAAGPRYFYVHQRNSSSYVARTVSKSGIGFFFNTGFNFLLMRHLLIDLFGEYAYEPASFSFSTPNVFGGSIQLSTVTLGAGIGYAF